MFTPPRLITELVAFARDLDWSLVDLARELGVSVDTLAQYRSGRRRLSMEAYATVARRFGGQRFVRDLAWYYATVDYHATKVAALESPTSPSLPVPTLRALHGYIARFATETFSGGRGLYVQSSDAHALTAALNVLAQGFADVRIPTCSISSGRKPTASEIRAALAAPALLVERTDFLCAAVSDLLLRRTEILRPTIVTSMRPAEEAEERVRRTFRAMHLVEINAATKPPHLPAPTPSHA